MDWDKMKTPDSFFLFFIPLSSSTSIFFSSGSRKHGIMNSNMYFKHIQNLSEFVSFSVFSLRVCL